MIYNWLKSKLSCFFPKHCLLCLSVTQSEHSLCSACEKDLPKNDSHCLICSSPLAITTKISKRLVCGNCQKKPPFYNTSLIPYLYASPIKQLITQFKFHRTLSYAPLLAQSFLNASLRANRRLPDCIIPAPLHKERLHERGFNQALELARIISKQLSIPLNYSLCVRKKATPFQSGLSAKQRKRNLKNAFSVIKTPEYRHVAIFDDVVTTGSTVNELAKQLKNAGVEIVEVWAIARTGDK